MSQDVIESMMAGAQSQDTELDLGNWMDWRNAQFAADTLSPYTDEELDASYRATNPQEARS